MCNVLRCKATTSRIEDIYHIRRGKKFPKVTYLGRNLRVEWLFFLKFARLVNMNIPDYDSLFFFSRCFCRCPRGHSSSIYAWELEFLAFCISRRDGGDRRLKSDENIWELEFFLTTHILANNHEESRVSFRIASKQTIRIQITTRSFDEKSRLLIFR